MNKRYCNGMVHVIKQGETLYQLSRRYRVPLALILRANPYVDVYNLQVGQEICIPMVRHHNGMICMPAPGMNPGNMARQDDGQTQNQMQNQNQMQGAAGENVQEEMREDRERGMVQMESEEGCQTCDEKLEKNDDGNRKKDDDDVEIYITTGDRSLGDILNEYGVKWEDFIRNNDLGQIALGEDVILYLPKKVLK
ncbi:MAG: LysM domain-containing protein [Roseburia sp.]|nr:LysM domain-containing protein [Roseburia sp.]